MPTVTRIRKIMAMKLPASKYALFLLGLLFSLPCSSDADLATTANTGQNTDPIGTVCLVPPSCSEVVLLNTRFDALGSHFIDDRLDIDRSLLSRDPLGGAVINDRILSDRDRMPSLRALERAHRLSLIRIRP